MESHKLVVSLLKKKIWKKRYWEDKQDLAFRMADLFHLYKSEHKNFQS